MPSSAQRPDEGRSILLSDEAVARRYAARLNEWPGTASPLPDETPPVLNVDEAAEILRVGRTTAYDAIRRGQIPSFRVGRKIRISRSALERLLSGETHGDDGSSD